MVELWGILTSLTFAWDKGSCKIAIETDSAVAVTLILKDYPEFHSCASIVNFINRLRMREWQVSITHIYMQANQIADWLASYALSLPTSIHSLSHPPPGSINLL
jgi:ribonuclease HI